MPVQIQYASDLHLEFYEGKQRDPEFFEGLFLTPVEGANLLVLAGDIGYPEMQITKDFIQWCCERWRHVVWVFGNHEYYYTHDNILMMNEKEDIATSYMDTMPNLHVLHNATFEHEDFPGIVVVGSTLWTEVPKDAERLVAKYMNDCRKILTNSYQGLTVQDWNEMYTQNVQFIKRELDRAEKENKKALVVTHHLPTYKAILPQYLGNDMNCAFASNSAELLENPVVAAWICGHSHGQLDLNVMNRIGKDVLVTFNARGYPREESVYTYNPSKTLVI